MQYDLAHPEQWADHIIVIPDKEPCEKCINLKMQLCPGKDKCIFMKGK